VTDAANTCNRWAGSIDLRLLSSVIKYFGAFPTTPSTKCLGDLALARRP